MAWTAPKIHLLLIRMKPMGSSPRPVLADRGSSPGSPRLYADANRSGVIIGRH